MRNDACTATRAACAPGSGFCGERTEWTPVSCSVCLGPTGMRRREPVFIPENMCLECGSQDLCVVPACTRPSACTHSVHSCKMMCPFIHVLTPQIFLERQPAVRC